MGRRELFVCQRTRGVQLCEVFDLVSRVCRRRRVLRRPRLAAAASDQDPIPYSTTVRTPIRNPVDPTYAEIEVHRSMICDRVRTDAFRRAIDSVVRPGDIVLDVGAGTGNLSLFAARAGAARVYAVERTTVAVMAQELAAANGFEEIVRVIHGDVMDVELPERVDVIVSEWLGGFGIDEGMLVPVIAARDRWLKPGGVMVPCSVTAWAGLVHDRYLGETLGFLRDNPYGLRLDGLVEMTINEITVFRHIPAPERGRQTLRAGSVVDDGCGSDPARAGGGAARSRDAAAGPRPRNGERPRALVQRRPRARVSPICRPWRSTHALGDDDGPAALARGTRARHGRPRQGQDRPGAADGDVDELGHRDAGRRLGGARRAIGMGGDRRLSRFGRVVAPWSDSVSGSSRFDRPFYSPVKEERGTQLAR